MMADANMAKDEARPLYNHALDVYKRSSQILLQGPMATAIRSPVVVVTMHNLIQVCTLMEDAEAACNFRSELVNVLRLMAGSHSSRGAPLDFYETCFIKFLSLPKAGAMAAAA